MRTTQQQQPPAPQVAAAAAAARAAAAAAVLLLAAPPAGTSFGVLGRIRMCCQTLLQAAFCWVRFSQSISTHSLGFAQTTWEVPSFLWHKLMLPCAAMHTSLTTREQSVLLTTTLTAVSTVYSAVPCGGVPTRLPCRQAAGASGAVCGAASHLGLCRGAAGATTCPAPGSQHHAGRLAAVGGGQQRGFFNV